MLAADEEHGGACTICPQWCSLEALARNRIMRGTRCRTNLAGPDAERDQYGFLKNPLPSDIITSGPIWELCKLLSPDFRFDTVTLNKFAHHEQCQHHWDKRNVGNSRIAFVGNFKGGALKLDDGRRFVKKKVWHTYNGAEVGHQVLPFTGERISIILYNRGTNQGGGAVAAAVSAKAEQEDAMQAGRGVVVIAEVPKAG